MGFLFVHRDVDTGIGIDVRHHISHHIDSIALHIERTSDVHKGYNLGVLVELVLYIVEVQRLCIEESHRNGVHTVVGATHAAFFGVVGVTVSRPVHLIFGVSVTALIVVAEVVHQGVGLHTRAAGR